MDKSLYAIKRINQDSGVQELLNIAIKDKKTQALAIMSSMVKNSYQLQQCTPMSIAGAVVEAISLNLAPQNGEIYIIPYGNGATAQIGYKGLIKLALNTGQIKTLNADVVKEGQYLGMDFLSGDHKFQNEKKSEKVIGYFAYLELTNGFRKTMFWTTEQMHEHFIKFSLNNYDEKSRQWMESKKKGNVSKILTVEDKAKITMLKQILGKWAPKTSELERAISVDGKVYDENGTSAYVSSSDGEVEKIVHREVADKETIKQVLNLVGKGIKEAGLAKVQKDATMLANAWAKEVGINFNESGGWYGITDDELTAFSAKAEQELKKEIIVNDIRISERQPKAEQDEVVDIQ